MPALVGLIQANTSGSIEITDGKTSHECIFVDNKSYCGKISSDEKGELWR